MIYDKLNSLSNIETQPQLQRNHLTAVPLKYSATIGQPGDTIPKIHEVSQANPYMYPCPELLSMGQDTTVFKNISRP